MRLGQFVLAMSVLIWALPVQAAPAATSTIRAVFVGIDDYAYALPDNPDAGFEDLSGAVNDTRNIKAALQTLYALKLDQEVPGDCKSANAVSITLLNKCATGAAILDAWRRQIASSAKGDTLILYFAGHGSQIADTQAFQQASGYNSTIMPHDARNPQIPEPTEILDTDIKRIIDEATAKGINVVSIFDSCNSATATRAGPAEGKARAAPRLIFNRPLPRLTPQIAPGPGEGYRVHLAASADGEDAREVGQVGKRSGVFTTALIATLHQGEMRKASFADIAVEVRLKVASTGHGAQRPHAEGALNARLGGKDLGLALLDAYTDADSLWLDGGQLTGVTKGSQYALFRTNDDAQANQGTELAKTTVIGVEAGRAQLRIDSQRVDRLPSPPKKMVARETAHAFGDEILLVRNGAAGADKAALADLLGKMNFVRIGEPAMISVIPSGGEIKLAGLDGFVVASLGPISSPSFADRLRASLQKIARVQMLLSLRTGPSPADLSFCVSKNVDANPFACQAATSLSSDMVIPVNQEVKLIAVNRAEQPRYIYVFLIDETFAVTLVLPPSGGIDSAVGGNRPVVDFGKSDRKQRLTFLTIATDQPIKASVLEQSGAGARDPAGCNASALARALCAAQQGSRDPGIPRVGRWTAMVTSAIVK